MNILLLEDDIALNRAIKKVLELDNHNVSEYYNGAEVINNINADIELFILDINVPNISGLDVLKSLYQNDKNVKVIMITSHTDIDTLKEAYKNGCVDYLKKPFHLEELKIKVSKYDVKIDDTMLTKKEKDFLNLLLEYKNKTVTYAQIEDIIYKDKIMSMNALRTMIKRLRAKLTDDVIINIIDEGYMIKG